MQRFLKWLGNKLFPDASESEPPRPKPKLRVVPPPRNLPLAAGPVVDPPAGDAALVEFDTALEGHIEDAGPGKNVLVRSKYVREDTGTHETLKIIDDSIFDSAEVSGFDPYNTGQFDRSRNWTSRTRE